MNEAVNWSFISSKYVQSLVKHLKKYLDQRGMKLPKISDTPIRIAYFPEIDVTEYLVPMDDTYYQ